MKTVRCSLGANLYLAVLVILMVAQTHGLAAQLIVFDFSTELYSTQVVDHISTVTKLLALHSGISRDTISGSARADSWDELVGPTNSFHFSFAMEPGYVADIERITFDYMSDKVVSFHGPTQYNVRVGIDGGVAESVSGGWNPMLADDTWYRGLSASNSGVVISNLAGYVTVAFSAKNSQDEDFDWYLDNIVVHGQVRPAPRSPATPTITNYVPRSTIRLGQVATGQYFSVQYSTNLGSGWKWCPRAANLFSSNLAVSADIGSITGAPLYCRTVTSLSRMPCVDLSGYWQALPSTNSYFRKGVMRFSQEEGQMTFEGRFLGHIADETFTTAGDGQTWMSGSVTGDTLSGRYAFPIASLPVTGQYAAVRFDDYAYDVWQGTNALTSSKYYDPATNGYEKLGESSTSATFVVSKPFLVVCANTMAAIDALQGNDSFYLNMGGGITTIWSANVKDSEQLRGAPDLKPGLVGDGYSEQAYRGYVAFGTVTWTALTVHVVSPAE